MTEKPKKRQKNVNNERVNDPKPETNNDSEGSDSEIEEEEGGTKIAGVYIPPAPLAVCSVESIGPRLVISHIVNMNFKSYAGRQVLGPFHKSFTCIIGPNGSGKSNVIDSMLFVFGYRATKIRSKKISVLLHKSEKHQDIQSASVEVHFRQIIDKEGEDFAAVEGSDFWVSRTAFQDNSSYYTINGKKKQFKDVAHLLGSHGIDLKHNRFLILQGEVEQIAMMKPKAQTEHETGMLEYLEDIIGTSRFKRPLEKLETKLNALIEERQEKFNRMKLTEKELEALKEPMLQAVEYYRHLNKITKINNKVFQIEKYKLTEELTKVSTEKNEIQEKMSTTQEKLKSNETQLVSLRKEMDSKLKEIETVRRKKEKARESLNSIENRLAHLKEEILLAEKKLKKSQESKKQEEKKLVELESVPETNSKRIEELKEVQIDLTEKRKVEEKEVQKVLAGLKEETKELQERKDQLNSQLLELNLVKDNAKAKYELAKADLEMYLDNEKKETAKLEQLKETLENVTSRLRSRKRELTDLETKIPESEDRLARAQTELAQLKEEEVRVVNRLNREMSVIVEKKQSLSVSTSRNRVLDFIMKQKQEGRIPGIFGRLGDLGGIDDKYDCAVSTACAILDHIIVDTTSTAKSCVQALKQSGVGRGNFIALDQQQKLISVYQRPLKTPENVLRLFDLIRVEDERVKPAFYFGLRDTLVAQDLHQARRVAYGATRFRVVTLSGEIIEIAGTMSGGGREKRTGRMGRSVTVKMAQENPAVIRDLEENVQRLQVRTAEVHQRQRELETEESTLIQNLKKWRMDFGSFKVEVQSLSEQEPALNKQLLVQKVAATSAKSNPQVVQEKTDIVESSKRDYEAACDHCEKYENDITKLTIKISAIMNEKMKKAQEKLDGVTSDLDKVTADITKLSVAIKTSGRNVDKSKARIKTLTSDIENVQERLTACIADQSKCESKQSEGNADLQELVNKLKEQESECANFQSQITSLTKEISKIRALTLDDEQKLQALEKSCHELKMKIAIETEKLSKLKLHVLPGEENENYDLVTFTNEEIQEMMHHQYIVLKLEEILQTMVFNPKAITDFQEKEAVYKERKAEVEEITDRKNVAKQGLDDAKKARVLEFMNGFVVISSKLKEMYQMITLGGDAELELKDSLDPFSEGISFSVRPPKKSWKHISNLSGGEKTLSSLALVFALHYYKPSPLYVMDEIDAALDFKNVSIVGNYIKQRTKNSQFIIISLRSNMFELGDVLVGIYKTHNCTKSVTISPSLYVTTPVRENNVESRVVNEKSDQNKRRVDPEDAWREDLEDTDDILTSKEDTFKNLQKKSGSEDSSQPASRGIREEPNGVLTEDIGPPPRKKKLL